MLFLPAAALCCLCSALVAMAAELTQDDLTLTRRAGQQVSSAVDGLISGELLCMVVPEERQRKFRVILYYNRHSCAIGRRYDHPQKNDFSAENKQNGCALKIQKVNVAHSATYYCACYKSAGSHSEK
ncbi:hypothetical protein GBF38_000754 [Nibea albiflora]|nr:hypothetical protein GBF38_000754 [Nibea albiflora]